MARVEAALVPLSATPSVVSLISAGRGVPMAAGAGTSADAMIRLAPARNAVVGFDGYKPLSAEAAMGLAPDAILLPDHVVAAAGTAEQAVALAGLTETPAARSGRIVVMDGIKLLDSARAPRRPSPSSPAPSTPARRFNCDSEPHRSPVAKSRRASLNPYGSTGLPRDADRK